MSKRNYDLLEELAKLYNSIPKGELRSLMAIYINQCSDQELEILEAARRRSSLLDAYVIFLKLLQLRERLVTELQMSMRIGVC